MADKFKKTIIARSPVMTIEQKLQNIEAMGSITKETVSLPDLDENLLWRSPKYHGYKAVSHNVYFAPPVTAMLEYLVERGQIRSRRAFFMEAIEKALHNKMRELQKQDNKEKSQEATIESLQAKIDELQKLIG